MAAALAAAELAGLAALDDPGGGVELEADDRQFFIEYRRAHAASHARAADAVRAALPLAEVLLALGRTEPV